ncbi:uncharacterized protein LOC118464074 isoform X4 [Anopheles albimanus]|uniref:uncharacterized protein LOC118464074 isoform X4 n=1 Tax=Anopheles albimanus TaxID=7167 RepID=UPI0016411CA4|nr:uncharacterized protein LOC118464074 isoform X4 [Anopheles albimanus]
MGDDVICIESDEDDEEADDEAGSSRAPRTPRGVRGGRKQQGGYWRQRRIARAARRKRDLIGGGGSGGIGEQSTMVAWLQGELQRLRHGPRKSDPTGRCAPFCQVVHRVRELVQEFQCRTAAGATSAAIDSCRSSTERTECWRHVLQFLLRTGDRKFDPAIGSLHRWQQQQQQDICDDRASNSTAKQEVARCEHRRCQLTVIDILVDYIRFRCQEMVAQVVTTATVGGCSSKATHPRTPPLSSARLLLAECNRIVSALFVIFDGDMEPVTLTLLHLDTTDRRYALLLYPLFESILRYPGAHGQCTIKAEQQTDGDDDDDDGRTATGGSWISCPTIPGYVRVLLCFQRWKSLVTSRADRAVIEGYAGQLMPARCPTVQLTADVAFLRLLPAVPATHRTSETRSFLLASEGLFELEQCIGQYMSHYRRTFCEGREGSVPSPSSTYGAPYRMSKHRRPPENGSNYINVRLLAELIERKSALWCAEHERDQREQEVDSLVNAMRLIFRNRLEFCELTLLQIPLGCQLPGSLLVMAGLFEALLTPRTAPPSPETATGRPIYRSNDVETYGRLMLCYAKWKALYRGLDDSGERRREWVRIDAIALSQLPNDFPRSICPRDALLRRIVRPTDGDGLLTTVRRRQSTTPTRFFLQTLPERPDLQELCYKFLSASRCNPDGTSPVDLRERHDTHLPRTSIAYQSLDSIIGSNRAGSSAASLAASALPTLQARNCTIVDAELTRTEMKPIIIPDSSGTDGRGFVLLLSVSGQTSDVQLVHLPSGRAKSTLVCEATPQHRNTFQPTNIPSPEVQTPKSFAAYGTTQPTSGCGDEPPGNSADSATNTSTVLDGDGALASGPELAECFLNTPPATPQQQQHQQLQQEVLPSELLVAEEERNRNVAQQQQQQHPQTGCRLPRLKGTLGAMPPRRRRCQRPPAAAHNTELPVKRALDKRRARRGRGQRRSKQALQWPSIMKNGCISSSSTTTSTITKMALSGTDTMREDRSKDELLLELIGCLEEEGTVAQQPDVDFAILPDRETVAPPSTLIDTSASIFGAEGDGNGSFVLLFTEPDGPSCWPVVQ